MSAFTLGDVAETFGTAALAALVGGLAAVERKGALQLMLSRPIVLAPLLGWALGDPRGGLMLGVPLELIFLGGVNLGGSLPDNETLLAAALTSAVVPAGISRCSIPWRWRAAGWTAPPRRTTRCSPTWRSRAPPGEPIERPG